MRVVIVYCTREFCNLLRWNYDREVTTSVQKHLFRRITVAKSPMHTLCPALWLDASHEINSVLRHRRPPAWSQRSAKLSSTAQCFGSPIWIIPRPQCSTP